MRLIDELEIVKAEHEDRAAALLLAVGLERTAHAALKLVFIQKPRDIVRLRAPRHARHHAGEELRPPVHPHRDARAAADPDIVALAALHAVFERMLHLARRLPDALHLRAKDGAVVLVQEICPMLRDVRQNLARQVELLHEIRREKRDICL